MLWMQQAAPCGRELVLQPLHTRPLRTCTRGGGPPKRPDQHPVQMERTETAARAVSLPGACGLVGRLVTRTTLQTPGG